MSFKYLFINIDLIINLLLTVIIRNNGQSALRIFLTYFAVNNISKLHKTNVITTMLDDVISFVPITASLNIKRS